MYTLMIDTCNEKLVIAIYKDDRCLKFHFDSSNRKQSEMTVPLIKEMLLELGIKLLEIEEVIVVIGPGSYTGVRIGITIVKTLALVKKDLKVYAVDSLRAYATSDKSLVVLDARSNKSYLGCYDRNNCLVEPRLVANEELPKYRNKYLDFTLINEANIEMIDKLILMKDDLDLVDDIAMLVPLYLKDVDARKQEVINIRAMQKIDIPLVYQLEQDVFDDSWTLDNLYQELDNNYAKMYVYTINSIIVGYLCLRILPDLVEITNIAVNKDYQGRGIGKFLVEYACEITKKYDLKVISLEVRVSNTIAKSLYQKCGFDTFSIRKGYYSSNLEDAIVMQKKIGG